MHASFAAKKKQKNNKMSKKNADNGDSPICTTYQCTHDLNFLRTNNMQRWTNLKTVGLQYKAKQEAGLRELIENSY